MIARTALLLSTLLAGCSNNSAVPIKDKLEYFVDCPNWVIKVPKLTDAEWVVLRRGIKEILANHNDAVDKFCNTR